jgi:hypothetical protein
LPGRRGRQRGRINGAQRSGGLAAVGQLALESGLTAVGQLRSKRCTFAFVQADRCGFLRREGKPIVKDPVGQRGKVRIGIGRCPRGDRQACRQSECAAGGENSSFHGCYPRNAFDEGGVSAWP